ncbi:hypothetical protein TNCV_1047601 [Trichonephila clavipes]|nr:hypothetical protein TNCV_1047601 [Trichonephila clavipes]
MNETTQQEKTTQLSSRNEQLNSSVGTKQLNSTGEKQLNSSVGTKQLNSAAAVDRLQPPTTAYNRLQPPATACNRLQPPATACNRLQPPATACNRLQPPAPLHRLYSRIGFFYLLRYMRRLHIYRIICLRYPNTLGVLFGKIASLNVINAFFRIQYQ